MFFAPTIVNLRNLGIKIHLLCLSDGGYDSDARERHEELLAASSLLDISVISLPMQQQFEDHPKLEWPASMNELIMEQVQKLHIDAIISFDEYGVSGHLNHVSISRALYLGKAVYEANNCVIYQLISTNVLLKYVPYLPHLFVLTRSLFDQTAIIAHLPLHDICFIPQRAMLLHKSQLLWFRYLYIIFSNYMRINYLVKV
ncbi:hypothetical protein Ciccas_011211 [Cichlidogyrus casuarinus]|uniref:N-acetylglucosaminylphosphatidylinositol deacetylase n=1 Tax=Cichlidogyrus casuarinus TaxID=1844966 RepID=A0ABD2PSQ1_9PLAT